MASQRIIDTRCLIVNGQDFAAKLCPTIVMLHGFLGNCCEWEALADEFYPPYRSLLIELPGHGQSSWERNGPWVPDFRDLAKQVEGVTRKEADPGHPIWLVGYSLGARVALYTLLRHPGLFAGAFLESVNPGISDPAERLARRQRDAEWARRFRGEDLRTVLRAWYAQPVFASLARDPAALEQLIEERAQQNIEDLAQVIEAWSPGAVPDDWPRLLASRQPIGVITGSEDPKFCAIADRLVAQRPATQRWTVPGAGHNVHRENPAAFLAALRQFIASHTPTSR